MVRQDAQQVGLRDCAGLDARADAAAVHQGAVNRDTIEHCGLADLPEVSIGDEVAEVRLLRAHARVAESVELKRRRADFCRELLVDGGLRLIDNGLDLRVFLVELAVGMEIFLPLAILIVDDADVREVRARLRQQAAIDVEVLDRVVVAVDEYIDALDIRKDVVRAVADGIRLAAEVADGDDEVTVRRLEHIDFLLGSLVHLLFREEGQAARALRVRRRDGRRRRQAEDADLEITLADDGMRLARERLARRVDDDVRRHDRELRLLDARERDIRAVVELVVAERHGIVAHGIHEVDGRLALAEIDEVAVLDGIAGIDEQDLVALGLVVLLERRDRRHAVDTVRALVVAVRVIRVQDDELREIRRKCRAPETGKDECQHHQYFSHKCSFRQNNTHTSILPNENSDVNHLPKKRTRGSGELSRVKKGNLREMRDVVDTRLDVSVDQSWTSIIPWFSPRARVS